MFRLINQRLWSPIGKRYMSTDSNIFHKTGDKINQISNKLITVERKDKLNRVLLDLYQPNHFRVFICGAIGTVAGIKYTFDRSKWHDKPIKLTTRACLIGIATGLVGAAAGRLAIITIPCFLIIFTPVYLCARHKLKRRH